MHDDFKDFSLWTAEQMRAHVVQILAAKDEEAIVALLYDLNNGGNRALRQVYLDTLFENDRHDLVERLPINHASTLASWARDHFEFMLEKCPNTYAKWEGDDYQYTLSMLSDLFGFRSPTEREVILKGLGTTRCEQRFHQLVCDHPQLWATLSPKWVGSKDSSLRQTALNLGWTPSMLVTMFSNDDVPDESICECFSYPYSTFTALHIVQESNRKSPLPKDFARHVQLEDVDCPEVANPRDVALANLLISRSEAIVGRPLLQSYRFQSSGGIVQQADDLAGMVDTYVALDCLHVLAESLAHDILLGVHAQHALDLPALDSPNLV